MAATNYTPISLYYSTTASAAPTAGNLVSGELAINITDGKLYYKDNGGSVQLLASKAGASGDVVGPASATDNAIVRFDGTTGKLVQNSVVTIADSTGDISGVGQLNATTVDTTNLEVTNIKAKDGTAAASIADSTGVVSITANPILSSGTANGVAYLNASKVLTTGSALTFDGTNLGLGVTPSAWGGVYKAIQNGQSAFMSRSGGSDCYILANNYYDGTNFRYINSSSASRYQQDLGSHAWYTAPSGTAGNAITFTQAMTLDASGDLLVGTTSVYNTARLTLQSATGYVISMQAIVDSYYACVFRNTSGVAAGSITCTTSATAYNTSSDYRLKDNIAPMTGALAKVAALKPVTYKWKADGSNGEGFIAHELAEVVPACVTGDKDAVDAEGKPVYQGIDTSFLVATLTAAIQEQQALINDLRARLAAAGI